MKMSTQEPISEQWETYFDSIAPSLDGMLVGIEVMSEQLGDRVDVERLPLRSISYDPEVNVMTVSMDGGGVRYPILLRYFIYGPRAISVQGSGPLYPEAILVTDAHCVQTLIRFFEPDVLGGIACPSNGSP